MAGSQEEHWYLEILERGKITCPTCKAVMRKTVEGLKKHMANCKEVPISFTISHESLGVGLGERELHLFCNRLLK